MRPSALLSVICKKTFNSSWCFPGWRSEPAFVYKYYLGTGGRMGWKQKLQHPSCLVNGAWGWCERSEYPHPSPQLPVEGDAPQAQFHPIRAARNKTEMEAGTELGLESTASRAAGQRGALHLRRAAWSSVACFRSPAPSTPTDNWLLRPLNEVAPPASSPRCCGGTG